LVLSRELPQSYYSDDLYPDIAQRDQYIFELADCILIIFGEGQSDRGVVLGQDVLQPVGVTAMTIDSKAGYRSILCSGQIDLTKSAEPLLKSKEKCEKRVGPIRSLFDNQEWKGVHSRRGYLVKAVTVYLATRVGIVSWIFLKKLGDVLDRIDQHADIY
jgi:hypothetical protein